MKTTQDSQNTGKRPAEDIEEDDFLNTSKRIKIELNKFSEDISKIYKYISMIENCEKLIVNNTKLRADYTEFKSKSSIVQSELEKQLVNNVLLKIMNNSNNTDDNIETIFQLFLNHKFPININTNLLENYFVPKYIVDFIKISYPNMKQIFENNLNYMKNIKIKYLNENIIPSNDIQILILSYREQIEVMSFHLLSIIKFYFKNCINVFKYISSYYEKKYNVSIPPEFFEPHLQELEPLNPEEKEIIPLEPLKLQEIPKAKPIAKPKKLLPPKPIYFKNKKTNMKVKKSVLKYYPGEQVGQISEYDEIVIDNKPIDAGVSVVADDEDEESATDVDDRNGKKPMKNKQREFEDNLMLLAIESNNIITKFLNK